MLYMFLLSIAKALSAVIYNMQLYDSLVQGNLEKCLLLPPKTTISINWIEIDLHFYFC